MHFYGWKKGLKTGMYYLRTRPAADAIKFTVDQQAIAEHAKTLAAAKQDPEKSQEAIACSLNDPEGCVMCSS